MLNHDQYTKFSDAEIGMTLERPVLVSSINENTARNGKPFLRFVLKDGFSEIQATMFDTTTAKIESLGVSAECAADARLSVTEYNGAKSFTVDSLMICQDKNITPDDFVKLPPIDLNLMYSEICSTISAAADDFGGKYTSLSALTLGILEKYKNEYMTSSAAISMHHNLKGGLLYHSYRMVKAANALCGVYNILDRELLVCGAALHDIGKIWEYETSPSGNAEFTSYGVLYGHLYIGANIINTFSKNYKCSKEKVRLLQHLILAHHGTQEWGTVSCPAIAEAFALHYIDNMDAKIYVCEEQYETTAPGECTEKKLFGMDNRIYRANYE